MVNKSYLTDQLQAINKTSHADLLTKELSLAIQNDQAGGAGGLGESACDTKIFTFITTIVISGDILAML